MARGNIRIGIGGWTFPPWRGTFYPPDLPQKRELDYASSHLGAIEINATFYGRQKPASWEKWRDTVPDDFQFSIKGSRFCVMRSKLADGAEGIGNFFAQGFSALGPRLGPILWQFAPRRQFDADDIAAFIALLPGEIDGVTVRHAIEPRHESFRDERFYDLCRARNIAIAFADSDQYPCIDARTADFAYARLQRMNEEVATGYAEPKLDEFAKLVGSWADDGRDCYVFMINGAKVRAPAAALALQERLR